MGAVHVEVELELVLEDVQAVHAVVELELGWELELELEEAVCAGLAER